jgi:hypothetical protein
MRESIFRFIGILELVYLDPIRYLNSYQEFGESWKSSGRIVLGFAALSVAVGSYYIAPPYLNSYFVVILFGFFGNFLIFLVYPMLLGALIDTQAQAKARGGRSGAMIRFIEISFSFFLLYSPICIIFTAFGFQGLGGGLAAMFLVYIGFLYFASRGIKYIYDIKDSESIKIILVAAGIAAIFPFLFNMYLMNYLINLSL